MIAMFSCEKKNVTPNNTQQPTIDEYSRNYQLEEGLYTNTVTCFRYKKINTDPRYPVYKDTIFIDTILLISTTHKNILVLEYRLHSGGKYSKGNQYKKIADKLLSGCDYYFQTNQVKVTYSNCPKPNIKVNGSFGMGDQSMMYNDFTLYKQ